MDKNLKKMKKENKDMYYNYLRKNHLHSPEQELSEQGLIKKILRLIGKLVRIAFILILLIIVIGLASSVIK
jgi:hypothetical protein